MLVENSLNFTLSIPSVYNYVITYSKFSIPNKLLYTFETFINRLLLFNVDKVDM